MTVVVKIVNDSRTCFSQQGDQRGLKGGGGGLKVKGGYL